MKEKLVTFAKAHWGQVVFDLILFVGVIAVIVLPQTHLYFEITHFGQIQTVVDHMQTQYQNNGNNGLSKEVKVILSN